MPGIEEHKTTTSEPEDKLPVHVFPDEGESVRLNERSNSSELMYHNKDPNIDTSAYDRVLHALNKLDQVHYTLSFFVRN